LLTCYSRTLAFYFEYSIYFLFCFTDTSPTEIYTLSLHDALPISFKRTACGSTARTGAIRRRPACRALASTRSPAIRRIGITGGTDRKSTRLNSSHLGISYAVFCLKKKKIKTQISNVILEM